LLILKSISSVKLVLTAYLYNRKKKNKTMDFKELGIKQEIVDALKEQGITEPTEIQQKTIPEIKQGFDIVGISKTGSGKTIAFTAPLIESLKQGQGIQLLIIVPIRELTEQVAREIRKLIKYTKLNVTVIYGGVALQPQAEQLRRSEIVVGTPGRLVDHLTRGSLDLSRVRFLVLDEADKMAMMGFIEDVEKIILKTSKARQTLLFGATISEEITMLKNKYMKTPKIIKSTLHVHDDLLNQHYYDIDAKEKFSLLVHLINKEQPKLAIVFCATRRNSEVVAENLKKQKIDAFVIHGGLSQNRRLQIIEGFHRGKPHILVATAVAARGLDVKNITHIFNYDLPRDPQEYIHQVGRTARAGTSGKAITLLAQKDHLLFSAILQRYPIKVTKLPMEEFKKVFLDMGRNNNARFSPQNNRFNNRLRFPRYNNN